MVSFICDACGQTVKKNRVEKHYLTECRNCSVLSCIDCGKDFHGDAYAEHTSCISEAEKYQGKLYKPKEKANKGEAKQQEWIKKVQETGDGIKNPKLKGFLSRIQEYSNVPRKKAKFINFCKNSLKLYDSSMLEQLWDAFSPQKDPQENGENTKKGVNVLSNGHSFKKDEGGESNESQENSKEGNNDIKKAKKRKKKIDNFKEDGNSDVQSNEDNCEQHNSMKKRKKKNENGNCDEKQEAELSAVEKIGKFSWHKAIKTLLKDAGEDGISMKRLQKKVVSEYYTHGTNIEASTKNECIALFKRKLSGYRKAKIMKEKVFYVKK